ncbi:ATP-binding cassette domain-containing protein [Actinokineospora sp. UTMC 2448]|uniref:ABC transporter ATP-binding protein n=1 Tax=Actinokineospora sp. UTMC 2448 TaxID=2268449 RepID=UPI0021643C08|nr:ATP-binding cassette domain-containing protein [Actinokineospora sp. UTMC 2448]UVS82528.1 Glutamine transport ATP-binding protein GlnQ [Actinokineospora sp. UTMC 2448]
MAIHASGLGVRFGDRWLFRGLDLAVEAGECLAVTGDNGSGKSTLLHCLYGVQDLTEGVVTVAGRRPDERDREFRRAVSVVLDDSALFEEYTPEQHLQLLGLADTTALPDIPAVEMSAGQRRRLLLTGALRREHSVLLLDEPERALDATARAWLADVITEAKASAAVVIASHNGPLVERVADQVVEL